MSSYSDSEFDRTLGEDLVVGPLGFYVFKYLSTITGILGGFILHGNGFDHFIYGGIAIALILFILGTMPLIRLIIWPIGFIAIMYSLLFDPHLVYAFVTGDGPLMITLWGIHTFWFYLGLGILGCFSIVQAGVYQKNLGTIAGATALSFLSNHIGNGKQ